MSTCAFEKSVSKMSALTNVALSATPAAVGVALRQLHHVGVVFDALRAEPALGGGDHRAAVAGAEVHEVVLRRHLRHVEHLLDQRLRRGHPHHVLARLSDGRFERLAPGRAQGRAARTARREHGNASDTGHEHHGRLQMKWNRSRFEANTMPCPAPFHHIFLARAAVGSPQTAEVVRLPLDSRPVLQFRYDAVHGCGLVTSEDVKARELWHVRPGKPSDAPLVGLALSGGGIRSASFGLGVLQALQQLRLFSASRLRVHGLGRRLHRRLAAGRHRQPAGRAAIELNGEEPREIRFLRALQQLPDAEAGTLQRRHLGGGRQQPSQPDPELHHPQPVAAGAALPAVAGGRHLLGAGGRHVAGDRRCSSRRRRALRAGRRRQHRRTWRGRCARTAWTQGRGRVCRRSARSTRLVVVPGLLAIWLVSTRHVGMGRASPAFTAGVSAQVAGYAGSSTRALGARALLRRLRVAPAQARAPTWATAARWTARGARRERRLWRAARGHVPAWGWPRTPGAHASPAARSCGCVGAAGVSDRRRCA